MKKYSGDEIVIINKIKNYLNRALRNENGGKSFSEKDAIEVYEVLGGDYELRKERDFLVREVLGLNDEIYESIKNIKRSNANRELERLFGKNKSVGIYSRVVVGAILGLFFGASLVSLSKLTGNSILDLFGESSFSSKTFFFFGLALAILGIFYIVGGKNGNR